MQSYNIKEFIWFVPAPRIRYAISFLRDNAFNLNTALRKELGSLIDIAFRPTEPVICLRKAQGENGLQVPASGSLSCPELSARLMAAGIMPPVRLTAFRQDGCWIAIPEAEKVPETVDFRRPVGRPRKVSAARIMEGMNHS